MTEHPEYDKDLYERWRLIKEGGDAFVEKYLKKRSAEEDPDFTIRKELTPDPGVASSAIEDVKNAFSPRMDVVRSGGSEIYQSLIKGLLGGVDKHNTTMDDFIKTNTLPELLYMGKAGILVQNYVDDADPHKFPYLVHYNADQIYNWAYTNGQLSRLVLKESAQKLDEDGFVASIIEIYRVFKLDGESVEVKIVNSDGKELDPITFEPGSSTEIIDLPVIPFVIYKLTKGLLHKIDKYQIAYLNLESSDLDWLSTANLPIYTEQRSLVTDLTRQKADGEEDKQTVRLGTKQGRAYSPGMDRPGFISPDSGPIEVSMKKQLQLQARIKDTLKTTLADVKMASAESLVLRDRGLEAGLSAIGATLNAGDLAVALIMHMYMVSAEVPNVAYPKKYELRTEEDRLATVNTLKELQKNLGSTEAKKAVEEIICRTILEGKVPDQELQKMLKEIQGAKLGIFDPETLAALVEAGIVSHELASSAIGAPTGDAAVAAAEHKERITAIKLAQSSSGVADESPDPKLDEKVKKNEATDPSTNTAA